MKYDIVRADWYSDLRDKVQSNITEGWEPIGGIGIEAGGVGTMGGYKTYYYQSMIKKPL